MEPHFDTDNPLEKLITKLFTSAQIELMYFDARIDTYLNIEI